MIKVLKAATNLPEMLFICQEQDVMPILMESVFLGLRVAETLYNGYPDRKIAMFDGETLLEIVTYDDEKELLPYMTEQKFKVGYKVNQDGSGVEIKNVS